MCVGVLCVFLSRPVHAAELIWCQAAELCYNEAHERQQQGDRHTVDLGVVPVCEPVALAVAA
jgi:hypothetical protein